MIRSLVWFRNDLRLHDNEALTQAIDTSEEIIPIYIFDERVFGQKTKFGFDKIGKYRAQFIFESVKDLQQSIKKKGGELLIKVGIPEDIIFDLCQTYNARWVYCNRERTHEEVLVQDSVENNLWTIGAEMRYCRGKMLYHTADLPFPITHTPDQFTQYRKEVEKLVPIREPLASPEKINSPKIDIEEIHVPTLVEFGLEEVEILSGLKLKGGESQALQELDYYFFESKLVSTYKKTRNELLGRDFSSKFSSYLSKGCISPKMIMHQLKKYEELHGANESTYWLFFELLWRDYFRLIAKKYGKKIFLRKGIKDSDKFESKGNIDWSVFNIWKEARTGVPFIDANMKELNETGFMSNRGRQNVASFLIHELGLNWKMGAEYFESLLIDYDPCSNYGNWNYLAGVGTDPRSLRKFNISTQSKKYDTQAIFMKYWLPELKDIPAEKLHDMSSFSTQDEEDFNLTIGKDYPKMCLQL